MARRKAEISENNKLHSFEILEELDISVVKISFQIKPVLLKFVQKLVVVCCNFVKLKLQPTWEFLYTCYLSTL